MMTHYKLDKIMKERKISLNRLAEKTELNINTLRKIKNEPFANAEIETLKIIAEALGCNVKDLIDDDAWSYFEKTHENKGLVNYLSQYQKYFDSDNIKFLQRSLSRIGINADITFENYFRALAVQSHYNNSLVLTNMFFRVLKSTIIILEVIDFDVYVNEAVLSEEFIKSSLIKMIDQYATKNEIECIMFQNFGYKMFEDFEVNIDGNTFTFQSNPEIDKSLLKNNGFFTYELPAPLPKENTWIKHLGEKTPFEALKNVKFD